MIGKVTMLLNHETVKAAIRLYFKDVVFKDSCCPNVTSVKSAESKGYGSWPQDFTVEMERSIEQKA